MAEKEIIDDFRIESSELLREVEQILLAWEGQECQLEQEDINSVFRNIHSIKGAAGFLGMDKITQLSHVMENLLMQIRDAVVVLKPVMVDMFLCSVDKLRILFEVYPDDDGIAIGDEIAKYSNFSHESFVEDEQSDQSPSNEVGATSNQFDNLPSYKITHDGLQEKSNKYSYFYSLRLPNDCVDDQDFIGHVQDELKLMGEILEEFGIGGDAPAFYLLFASVLEVGMMQDVFESLKLSFTPCNDWVKQRISKQEKITTNSTKQIETQSKSTDRKTSIITQRSESADTIRVGIKLLDKLVNTVGELVLGRNRLLQTFDVNEREDGADILQNINLVTSELQELVMQTRMQPVGNVFKKFKRIVRDLSKTLGKKVELTIQGEDVELDKSILESIADPLTHLIRNSVDHGLETAEDRKAVGKNEIGHIVLRAYHEGGQISIEISDDGKGIDPAVIKKVALEKELINQEDADKLSDLEAIQLIFSPGFSTAAEVSDVSGRGVGMDVVKTNIERLGGHIDLQSEFGFGTVVDLRLPLTLAIIPSLLVSTSGQHFAVPQASLVEVVRLETKEEKKQLERFRGADALRLRNRLLPLVMLADVLEFKRHYKDPLSGKGQFEKREFLSDRRSEFNADSLEKMRKDDEDRRKSDQKTIVILVVQVGHHQYGLIVDDWVNIEEIVVKPLSSFIEECEVYAGATILGNGAVAMILDVVGIAKKAKLKFSDIEMEKQRRLRSEKTKVEKNKRLVLIFNCAADEYFAVPLERLNRVEEICRADIQNLGDTEYIQYAGGGLPIIRLNKHLPVQTIQDDTETLLVLVSNSEYGNIGILASRVLGSIETEVSLDSETFVFDGVLGSAIVQGNLTLFLDLDKLFSQVTIGEGV